MLVCSVSRRTPRGAVAADILEAVAALDATDFIVRFGTVVDSPGNAIDTLNAVVGQFMTETASAADVVTVGMAYRITLLEDTTAIANNLAVIAPKHVVTATVTEAATAASTQGATVPVVNKLALYETTHVATATSSSLLGTEVPDSGPTTEF